MKTSALIWIGLIILNAFNHTCAANRDLLGSSSGSRVSSAGRGTRSGTTAQSQPWVTWSRNPLTIPVSVGVSNVLAETNTTVTVKLADGSIIIDGYNCSESTNRSPFIANLKVRREYQLSVVASNLTALDMKLTFKPNWTVLGRNGKAAKPKEYKLLVDRQLSADGTIYVSNQGGACSSYSNTWTIELTERLPANWRLEDGSDNAEDAPGDGGHPIIGPGKSMEISRAAFSWSVGLGRLMDGQAAGRLTVREAYLSPDIYTPTNIYFTTSAETFRDEVQLITLTTNCPVLRQVKAYQTFVDIVSATNSTEMRFYFPVQVGAGTNDQGHYTNITGNPFVVWALMNPEPSTKAPA